MSKHGLNKISEIMAYSAEQLKRIEADLQYMNAIQAFYPTEEEKAEMSDERIAAMEVIIKYQADLRKRLEDNKVVTQQQFDWAKEEYLNLIEQCQQDAAAMALEIDKQSSEMPPDIDMSEITEKEEE